MNGRGATARVILSEAMYQPSLFNDLFKVRIREDHSPKENFLSESFAHILRAVPGACEGWVSKVCGRSLILPEFSVSTRTSEVDRLTGTVIFPDLRIDATTADGESIVVFAERKWDSPCRVDQLQNYRRIGERTRPKARLTFVGARRDQVLSAKEHVDVSLYWENAYELLESVADQSEVLEDFLYFMKSQGLGPMAAITPEKLKAFVEGNDLPFQLSVFCRKLADEYTWKNIPGRYYGTPPLPVEDRYGRVAIEFLGAKWAPTITLGFLYSNLEHRVPFTDPDRSIDLLLRIETSPKLNPNPESLITLLKQKSSSLRQMGAQTLVKGDPDNRNHNTLLIVQQSLTVLLGGIHETSGQLEKIHQTFEQWLSALFADGSLEPELLKLRAS
jgi:hypothetical protein